jgi:ribonucleoside-diphosphate reductase alpha chain
MSEAAKPLAAKRERLPDRRASETFSFELEGVRYHATVGRYGDGRPGEIFISSRKAGSATDVAARDAAIAISFALQFGARLEDIARALSRDSSGRASGPAGRALDSLASRMKP